jgi:hypothetical protein
MNASAAKQKRHPGVECLFWKQQYVLKKIFAHLTALAVCCFVLFTTKPTQKAVTACLSNNTISAQAQAETLPL